MKNHDDHSDPSVSRRYFVAGLAATAATSLLPTVVRAATADALRSKRLVVWTLFGGNDGLNTLVPYTDPLYYRYRTTLALPRDKVLPLNDELAFNPALRSLAAMYQAGEVAIVPDVGYRDPDLSHFESKATWESGERRPSILTGQRTGWWAKVVAQNRSSFDAAQLDTAAISFEASAAFAKGERVPVLHANQNLGDLFAPIEPVSESASYAKDSAARDLAAVVAEAADIRTRVTSRLAKVPRPVWRPSEEPIHVQARLTDWFLANGVSTPLVRMELGGFDHHTALLPRHHDLMAVLDRELSELRDRLRTNGLWQDTVIMLNSEFGRRPVENGFAGTDHGTAGPVMLIGGAVQGGIWGPRADLDNLDAAGNLRYRTDFRSLYASVVTNLFRLPSNPFLVDGVTPLPMRLG